MLSRALIAVLPFLAFSSASVIPHPVRRECHAHNTTSSSTNSPVSSSSVTSASIDNVAAFAFSRSGGRGHRSTVSISTTDAIATASAATSTGVQTVTEIVTIHTTHSHAVSVSSALPTSAVVVTSATIASSVATVPSSTDVVAAVGKSSSALVASSSAKATSASLITSTTSSAEASTTTSSSSTSSSGKGVGLALDDTSHAEISQFTGLDWYYTWGLTPFSGVTAEFVPCVWGSDQVAQVASTTFPSGTQYILGFNEPDQALSVGGSAIDATTAATLHQQWTAALTADLTNGAPAVARGSTTWYNDWVTARANKCQFDFVPIHFYGTSSADLISYIESFPAQGKPIWVTEFSCIDYGTSPVTYCTEAESETFMKAAIEWFEGAGSQYVKRWAWFGAFPKYSDQGWGMENADGSPNALATTYLSL